MTQEDKKLLIKDLCARLPYGVAAKHKCYNCIVVEEINTDVEIVNCVFSVTDCKPYLFPMSSMPEEQKIEYFDAHWNHEINISVMFDHIDWLNAHHFDYRGLIDRGLAIDCTDLNIY